MYTVKKNRKSKNYYIFVINKDFSKIPTDLNTRSHKEKLMNFSWKSERIKFFQPLVGYAVILISAAQAGAVLRPSQVLPL